MLSRCKKYAGEELTLIFVQSRSSKTADATRRSRSAPAHPLGVTLEPPGARRGVPAGQARPAKRRGIVQRPFSSFFSSAGCWQPDKTLLLSEIFAGARWRTRWV